MTLVRAADARIQTAPDPELTWRSAGELARLIAEGSVSARDVLEAHLARIEAVDRRLNAVIARRFDEARAEADAVDAARARGETLGPLAGVPMTVKEQFHVKGLATTFGLPSRKDLREQAEGPLVTRLREAGAIIVGKTNIAELLFYQEGDNPLFGRTNNPWDLDRTSGGGSGGEGAIIAAGGSPLGLAADIGGSIRTPAHFCGIQGLRPTSGRLTNLDSPPEFFFPGMDAVVLDPGPMARTVADLDLAMRVLAAPGLEKIDPRVSPMPWPDPAAVSIEGLRIGMFEDDGYWPASPALRRAVREASEILTRRGATVVPFADPDPEAATRFYFSFLTADGVRWPKRLLKGNPRDRRVKMLLAIAWVPSWLHEPIGRLLTLAGQPRLANGFLWSKKQPTKGYWDLLEQRAAWRARFLAEMDARQLDAIICPPHTVPAMRHGATYYLYDTPSYLMRFNVLGMPAGSVAATRVRPGEETDRPRSWDQVERSARATELGSAGLPVGVQVAARHWREDVVLAVMGALEDGFSTRPDYPARPPAGSDAGGDRRAAERGAGGIVNLLRFGADPLGFMTKVAHTSELGIVAVRTGPQTLRLVTDPALIRRTLELDDPPTLGRGRFPRVARWYGDEGIFAKTSGPEHARQRDVLGRPIWNDPQTPGIARRRATEMSAAWREGEPVDVWRAFRRLHFETDWEQLTGEQADEPVLAALEAGDAWQPKLIQPGGTLLWRLPPGRGARRASALLDRRVDALIEQRRRSPDPAAPDQLSRLVRQAAEDGVTTDQQIRATVKLQFPDPIHDLLTWLFWALARNPLVEQAWLEEIDRVLAGAPVTVEDVERLPYVHRVVLETMRLYPPAFGIFREALRDLDIDGHRVPAGDLLVMSQWVTHRDPRLWEDPLRFDPERWADGAPRPDGFAYFPFSSGPHACHGSRQALLETTVVATTISRRWRLRAQTDREPAMALGLGLQPKKPLRLVPVARF